MIYNLMLRIITYGAYDAEQVMDQLDVYLAFGRITREQYAELASMVSAKTE